MIRVLAFLLLASPAFAQQAPTDPATLQRAITILQQQRNQALDMQANSEMRAAQLTEENAKLKAELDELRKKQPPAKK